MRASRVGVRRSVGRRQLRQPGEPLQGVVGRCLLPRPVEHDPPVDVRALVPIPGVAEVGRARGQEDAGAAGLGPALGGVEQLAQGLRGHGFEVVEDHQRGRLLSAFAAAGASMRVWPSTLPILLTATARASADWMRE